MYSLQNCRWGYWRVSILDEDHKKTASLNLYATYVNDMRVRREAGDFESSMKNIGIALSETYA
jgi:hypothetical protein